MKKELTAEQLQRKAFRKQKEIARWEKEKARPKKAYFIIYFIFIVCLIYVVDEVAYQIGGFMKTEIANDLLSKYGDKSIGMLDIVGLAAIPVQALSALYKPFADRFGRKLFLIVNTLGMSLGLLVVSLTTSLYGYLAGLLIVTFFVPREMQVVYVMESTPKEHRAKIYSLVRALSTLGIMIIPILRKALMNGPSEWRNVFLIPAIIGVAISFISLFFARETDSFIEKRLSFLKMTDEELVKEEKKHDGSTFQGGFFHGFKFAFTHKQLRWIFISNIFVTFGIIITLQYQPVMSYGFAKNIMQTTGVELETALELASLGPVSSALFFFPVGSAIAQLIVGFAADYIGRKKTAILMSSLTVVSFILLALGSNAYWNPYLVGFCCGAAIGSYYGSTDILGIMISESSPTNLRSSIMSAQSVVNSIGWVIAYGIGLPLITICGNSSIPIITLACSIPGSIIGLFLLMTKVKDTKGVDLEKVTGLEWDANKEAKENESQV